MERSIPFLTWLSDWQARLETVPLSQAIPQPGRAALLCVDLTVGFTRQGILASPRIAQLVPSITALFDRASGAGVQHFVLIQDRHTDDALEFSSFGPHCVAGSTEADTVPELLALPFSDRFAVIPKNSISAAIDTTLEAWLRARHRDIDTFVVVGDCTDLCAFHLAMHLRLRANAHGHLQRVIVPADCVQTYDIPVDTAKDLGIMPHDGDLLHAVFLYQMALNGIQVIASLS